MADTGPRRARRAAPMHPLRRLLWDELDRHKWKAADLARASGISAQTVSLLLNDDRDQIAQLPDRDTLVRIAYGFRIPEAVVFRAAAASWGVPIENPPRLTAEDLSNDEILTTLARRLGSTTRATRRIVQAASEPSAYEKRR